MAKIRKMWLTSVVFLLYSFMHETDSVQSLSQKTRLNHEFSMDQNSQVKVTSLQRKKRSIDDGMSWDAECQRQGENFHPDKDGFANMFQFDNETNYSLALAWTGKLDGRLIVAVTQEMFYMAKPSRLYLSTDDGKSFQNITDKIDNSLIRKDNGLQNHPLSIGTVMVVTHTQDEQSDMYITEDGGDSFHRVSLPFMLENALYFHPTKEDLILAQEVSTSKLFLSMNKGRSWDLIHSNVLSVKWTTYESDPVDTIYALLSTKEPDSFDFFWDDGQTVAENSLQKCTPQYGKCSWKTIREQVYTFGMEGKFLYISRHIKDGSTQEELVRLMEVSTDGGNHWAEVQLPSVTEDRFYSILDMSEELIFMHVDNPGDTGHGTLYISDATGIVFTESLQRHLYPNFVDVTDFYKVRSMRGVYLASQMEQDNSIHTMITFDRGGEWQSVNRPEGVPCQDENKGCFLQIHNQYSMVSNVKAQMPLSVENAVGLILVHGHVADALQNTDPDVFVSSDGGYTWRLALKGPHHYEIADQGGLLVAVPADTDTPNVIKFSTDEGHCWHEYTFTTEQFVFTRLLTEPENKAMKVAIWGYNQDTRVWKTHVIDFQKVIERQCYDVDYEPWMAHFDNSDDPEYKGCLLGIKETFLRLKPDSWCYNGHARENKLAKQDTCKCTQADYDCDYGYYRPDGFTNCVPEPAFKGTELDICLRGHVEELVTVGYHKIPGDKCEGGFKPQADTVVDLKRKCKEGDKSVVEEDMHLQASRGDEPTKYDAKKSMILAIVVLVGMLIAFGVIAYVVKRYGFLKVRPLGYKYSTLQSMEADDLENALGVNTSLYEDSSDEETASTNPNSGLPPVTYNSTVTTSPARQTSASSPSTNQPQPPKVKSYHDDSDDDLLE